MALGKSSSISGPDPGALPPDREAQLLAELLRSSRVTVLCGEAGADTATLLQASVLPLLHRRAGDRCLSHDDGSREAPVPDRRCQNGREPGAEVAVLFDAWGDAPLSELQAKLASALGLPSMGTVPPPASLRASLMAWNEALGVRFLIVLDRFERFLAAPPDDPGVVEFSDEFVRAVNEPALPANFLISLQGDAEPLLERFGERIPDLGEACLRLSARHRPAAARPQADRIDRTGQTPPAPGRVFNAQAMPALKRLAVPLVCASLLLLVVLASVPRARLASSPPATAAAVDVTTAAAGDATTAAAAPAILPPASAANPPLPAIELVTDAQDDTDDRVARDLARIVPIDVGHELAVRSGVPLVEEGSTVPVLAVVRHDVLQAASRDLAAAGRAVDGLRIVMPLYTEEIHFIVRSDSPLAFIHEIQASRINFGPSQGRRRFTATMFYEQMFGTPAIGRNISFLDDEQALGKLVGDGSIDVMIVVAAQPAKWLAELAPPVARSIKLLKLDRRHGASQRAAESYLPTVVRAANYRAWLAEDIPTLAAMTFLASFNNSDPVAAERLGVFVHSLCRSLPVLRRDGHPKWREVQPDLQLEVGWAYSAPAESALRSCLAETAAADVAAARPQLDAKRAGP